MITFKAALILLRKERDLIASMLENYIARRNDISKHYNEQILLIEETNKQLNEINNAIEAISRKED
jgi:hypothetical protein